MKKANIIILSGQSNAVGVGFVNCLSRHFNEEKVNEYLNGYENIKINYFSHDKRSHGFVKVTVGCTEIQKFTIGPEVGIAEFINENFEGEEFFIVKSAVGGADLKRDFRSPSSGGNYCADAFGDQYEDMLGAFFGGKPIKAGWCYNELVKILHESIDYLTSNGYEPVIKAFCWMQGESDAGCIEDVNNYHELYANMISDLKAEFVPFIKDCAFIDAGISTIWAEYIKMNEFKKNYAETHENSFFIDTIAAGLTTTFEPVESPDIYHYDSDSVIKLGKLFAEKISF